MVVGNHLFSFFDKKFREGVTRYELHPPSLRTVYFPTAPFFVINGKETLFQDGKASLLAFYKILRLMKFL